MSTRSKGVNLSYETYDAVEDRLLSLPVPPKIIIGIDFDTTREVMALQKELEEIVEEVRQYRNEGRLERNIETINRRIGVYKRNTEALTASLNQYLDQIERQREDDARDRQQMQDMNNELTEELERVREAEEFRLRLYEQLDEEEAQMEMWDDPPPPPQYIPDSDEDEPVRRVVLPDTDDSSLDEDEIFRLQPPGRTQPLPQRQPRRRRKPKTELTPEQTKDLFDRHEKKWYGSCLNCLCRAYFVEENDSSKIFCNQQCQRQFLLNL
jgi:uncharacterized protein YeeX (DUF496 family)